MEASGAPRCALADVLSVRLSRDDLEKWVNQLQAADDVACGCFVRVLLDGDADCRKYRMARIHSVSTIPNAYTFGNLTTTDKLLTLDFGHFSASYQMNTISNSPILQTELDDWLRSGKVSLGDFEAFLGRKQAQLAPLRAGGPARRSDTTMVDRLASDSSSRGTISRLATEMDQDTVEPVQEEQQSHKKRNSSRDDPDTRLQALLEERNSLKAALRQSEAKVAELKDQLSSALLPVSLDSLSVPELAELEQRAELYRQKVRQVMGEKQKCSICMEKDSCIIFYPCKHALTCETCSEAVSICPMCRTPIQDRIKPYK